MALFEVGELYRDRYLIESVVPFFKGELAIATYNNRRFYLQSAELHRQAPVRAIAQYENLQLREVIPYQQVMFEPDMLVFVRPYVAIRPLREVIETQELSEEQVVRWIRDLLHVEAVLKAKPMPMYLLLDLRNVGVNAQNELRVFFCGLDQIMVHESKLDWGTFIYSMLSGQFLDGPILRLPKNFKVSRPMVRLIQKSFKEYTVPPVLEQVELFENKQQSSGLLSKLWGDRKEEITPLLTPTSLSPVGRPVYKTSEETNVQVNPIETKPFTQSNQSHVDVERGTSVKEDKLTEVSDIDLIDESNIESVELNSAVEPKVENVELEPIVELEAEKEESEPIVEATSTGSLDSNTEQTIEKVEAVIPQDSKKNEEQEVKETEQESSLDGKSTKEKEIEEELTGRFHPKANSTTFKVSPALAELDGQEDLSHSFVLKLNLQQAELERQQQERLKQMRRDFERQEQELIEKHRKQLELEQQQLLEEQRKKLEQEQQELLQKKREELENQEKEKRKKAKLEQARKEFEAKERKLLKQEEQAFKDRQAALLQQLEVEFEERKRKLLVEQQQEFENRTKQKLAELEVEWKKVEADNKAEVITLPSVEVTEESDKTDQTQFEPIEAELLLVDDLEWEADEPKPTDKSQDTVFSPFAEPVESVNIFSNKQSNLPVAEETKQEVKTEEPVPSQIPIDQVKKQETNPIQVNVGRPEPEAVFTSEEPKQIENMVDLEISEVVEEQDDEDEEEVSFDEAVVTEDGAEPKKKKRRRRRRKRKKASNNANPEVAATEVVEQLDPSIEDERKKRERELEQMEKELLEIEEMEKVQAKNPPKIEQQEKVQVKNPPKESPEVTINEVKQKPAPLPPEIHTQPKVPVVKDTTEHATLAKQFEQYLKLFQKKK